MSYNFNFDVSAQISAKTVEEMVKKVVEEQTGKKVARIEMKVQHVTKGLQTNEYTESTFNGCTVYFENDKVDVVYNKSFKKDNYE